MDSEQSATKKSDATSGEPVSNPADANGAKADGAVEVKKDESKAEDDSRESAKPKEEAEDDREVAKKVQASKNEDEKKDESKSDDKEKEAKDDKDKEPPKSKKEKEESPATGKEDKPTATGKEDKPKATSDDKKRKAEDEEPQDGKRKRKTAAVFKPEDFSQSKTIVNAYKGRGDKLRDLEGVKESIERHSHFDEVVVMAYRFVFSTRGKPPKQAKDHLLDFTGYLPAEEEGEDKAKTEERDEELETKYSKKAYKMTIPQIRMMCDFFDVDRTPGPEEKVDKDVMIDRLLDFLSAPDPQYTNVYAKKNKKKAPAKGKTLSKEKSPAKGKKKEAKRGKSSDKESKKKKPVEKEAETESSDDEEMEDVEKGEMPNDAQLRKWVKAYVACHNMNKATLKHALDIASDKFGVDMKEKKKTIKMILTEEC